MYFVYILKSLKTNKSYVGSTSKEVGLRLRDHNLGSNEWTTKHKPFKLVYYESLFCKQDALHRENFLKSGVGRKVKDLLINHLGD